VRSQERGSLQQVAVYFKKSTEMMLWCLLCRRVCLLFAMGYHVGTTKLESNIHLSYPLASGIECETCIRFRCGINWVEVTVMHYSNVGF
jgi:hypothetical protein